MTRPARLPGLEARTPLGEAAPRLLLARLRDLRLHLRGAKDGKPDAVHDMRVAARRLRVALDLLGGRAMAGLADEVKALQDALGAVRDLHVEAPWLESSQLARLAEERASLRTRARLELGAALQRFEERTSSLLAKAARKAGGHGKLGGHRLRETLSDHAALLKARLGAAASLAPKAAHRARIAAKKLRYQLELLGPALPRKARDLEDELETLQDALGELHDADARLALLRGFLETATEDEVPLSLSALAQLCAERDQLAGAAAQVLGRWRKKRLAQRLRRAL